MGLLKMDMIINQQGDWL